jgi:acetyl coenzyme A synthetase (ADP forming)-like protein
VTDVARPSLEPLFTARSVAVVGASADPLKVGGSVLANLLSAPFRGRIVAVNPAHAEVQGVPAVPTLREVNGAVDVAVIAVPADDVADVLRDCVAIGIRAAVVLSAGFRETGAAGRAREGEITAWLARQPLRIVGPNCVGWIRPSLALNLSFAAGTPAAGPIGFFSQSGALCTAILDWSREHMLGFSLFASLGNQVDVTEADVIRALADDPETRVIAGYVEGVADGSAFFAALREAAHRKPCVLMKAGRSASGARAAASHTGALAGADRVFDAAVAQAGGVRAHSIEELFDLTRALAVQPLPRHRRLVIVTNGGGPGILAADAAQEFGLSTEPLPAATQARLRAVLPPTAALGNPVDLIGDADAGRYRDALHALDDEDAAKLVILSPQAATDATAIAHAVRDATARARVPIMASFLGGPHIRAGAATLEAGGIPCYPFPERAVRTLGAMAWLAERRGYERDAPPEIDSARAQTLVTRFAPGTRLGMLEAGPLLEAAGVPVLRAHLARTAEEAASLAMSLGFPVALKIVSAQISHKTDVGGVALGLASAEAVHAGAAAMLARVKAARPAAVVEGLLVQSMLAPGDAELVIGAIRDPQFGPVVMVGFGGIFVEVLDDTTIRLAPIGRLEARRMLDALKLAPVLHGVRGRRPVALDAIADALARLSVLVATVPRIVEIELNPLVATPEGVMGIDARGVLGPSDA